MPFYKKLWWLILVLSLSLGGVFFAYWLTPFEKLKSFFDLIAPDGNLEIFTSMLDQKFEIPIGVIGAILLIAGIILGVKRKASLLVLRDSWNAFAIWCTAAKEDTKVFLPQ